MTDHFNGHFPVGDSHHTTIDANPTHMDSHNACGHIGVTTDLNSHVSVNAGVDGCISTTGGGLNTHADYVGGGINIHW